MNSQLIGMTITRAAKERSLLEMLDVEIVIVEEAAEILEVHQVAALPSTTQQLILIGEMI